MLEESAVTVYSNSLVADTIKNPFFVKVGMAQMLRGGAIIEVSSLDQAKLAESADACSVLVSDLSLVDGRGISRMPDLVLVKEIKQAVSISIIARSSVGHFVESQILEAIGVDYIDESEVIALADEGNFVNITRRTTRWSQIGGGSWRRREGDEEEDKRRKKRRREKQKPRRRDMRQAKAWRVSQKTEDGGFDMSEEGSAEGAQRRLWC